MHTSGYYFCSPCYAVTPLMLMLMLMLLRPRRFSLHAYEL